MGTTRQLTITLPTELADAISERVASGMYASESEVIQDSLSGLLAQDEALEHWLRTEAVAAYDELRRDPGSGMPYEEFRQELDRLRAERKARLAS